MPSTSNSQRTLMCVALSIKRGETPTSYSKEAARLASQMSEAQLEDNCKSPAQNNGGK